MHEARLAQAPFAPDGELADFSATLSGDGAVVSFVGFARPQAKDGRRVKSLFLDHHPRLTARSLADIAGAAARLFDVSAVRVVHRCGAIAAGEPIVMALAASAHRRAAFEAVDYLMDRLKTEAVFWKREDGEQGSAWIEPTQADYVDRARWSDTCQE